VLAIGQELGDEQLTAIPSAMIGLALAVQGQWAQGRPAAQPSGAGPREVRHNVKGSCSNYAAVVRVVAPVMV
jgi:hypothetical protein